MKDENQERKIRSPWLRKHEIEKKRGPFHLLDRDKRQASEGKGTPSPYPRQFPFSCLWAHPTPSQNQNDRHFHLAPHLSFPFSFISLSYLNSKPNNFMEITTAKSLNDDGGMAIGRAGSSAYCHALLDADNSVSGYGWIISWAGFASGFTFVYLN